MISMASPDAARQAILARYPSAHFGRWFDVRHGRNMPVWENSAIALRYELGEIEDANKPVAYILDQNWKVTF